jgi:tRNA nucleotidyltransferase (CCA-adding enzyme)
MIPNYVLQVFSAFKRAGYSLELVGGSVRNLLLKQEVKDWDLTTPATPEQILQILPEAKYENSFGTVIYPIRDKKDKLITVLEITTYRSESNYSDHRRPDNLKFEKEIEKDLARRDFTINALACSFIKPKNNEKHTKLISLDNKTDLYIIDLFGGIKDLNKGIIRAVGEPEIRFKEDALRMLRAIRFAVELNFKIEEKTKRAIAKLAFSIKFVANERIKDELIKILKSSDPAFGFKLLFELNLLNYIIPELIQGKGIKQNHHHIYEVLEHNLLSLKHCPSQDWRVRLAALFHDIAKPKVKKYIDGQATFYNHEYVGAKMVEKIMTRLRFSSQDKDKVVNLVKNHMFYYNVGEVTAASVRRLINKVGKENLKDLIDLRVADRLGSGTPKAMPYKLRHLQYMMERVQNDPVSAKMLKVSGDDLIKDLQMKPGPSIGAILDILLSEVIEEPDKNNKKYLIKRAKELNKLDLKDLREFAKKQIEEQKIKDDKEIKYKYKI